MACAATLKRSLEFDPVHSPSHSSAKRKRFMPVTLTPSTPPSTFHRQHVSPFSGVAQKLTSEQITASIAQEMKRMQRRRQLYMPSTSARAAMSNSTSTPEKAEDSDLHSHSTDHSPQLSRSLTSLLGSLPSAKKDVPLFTFRQVSLLCERMLRDREEEVREEYDKVLSCKLAEQYEAFLKFNHDQLHLRFGHSDMSYVS